MLKPSTKNTALGAIGVFLLGTILTSPYWFPGVWQLLSKETFLEWLRGAWPTMTPSLYLYFKLFLYAIAVGLLLVILWAIHQQKKQYVWLEDIADEDDADIENRIQVFQWEEKLHGPVASLHPSEYEPSIDLKTIIQNNTVYTLTITHIDGGLAFEKSYKSRPYYDLKIVNSDKKIKHVRPYKLKLRQHIHPDSAKQIINDGGVTLRGGNTAVCCTYENRAGEQKSIRIPLNDLTFPVRVG